MSYQRKTQISIDEIPAELCTRREATEILGLNNCGAFNSENRLMKLPTVHVVYKGNRIVLYNRRMIEALKYKPVPDGYISTKEACKILNRIHESSAVWFMRRCGIERVWVERHHSGWYWNRAEVEAAKNRKNKPVPKGYISTKEASEILNMRSSYGTIYNLRKHGVKSIQGTVPNSGWYWKRKDVENVKRLRKTCAHVKKS